MLFGGESTEHEVSLASARNVSSALNKDKFAVKYGYIGKDGRWWITEKIDGDIHSDIELLPSLGNKSFIAGDTVITPDVILPILHGKNGEDGSVQALAQLLHIPIVGCDMTSSALAMNKQATKEIAESVGIPIVPFTTHHIAGPMLDYGIVSAALGMKLFVKPANAGSSVGVSKVTEQDEFEAAINLAHQHDNVVLIEQAVDAQELEIAVLGNYPDIETSVVGEIKPDGDYYSYDSKYDEESTSAVVIPARISDELSENLQLMAKQIFEVLGCSGMARVDFFVNRADGAIYLNEVNTIPGFTDISMYPKLWNYSDVSYSELLERLIELALQDKVHK